MNKLKFLYDVVQKLRDKEVINGVATVEVNKDQAKVFYVKNEFQKNFVTMQTKASITSEVNYEGKQVKHQSTTEFTKHCPGNEMHGMHHRLFRHMNHAGGRCGSIKDKLTKLSFVLGLLNSIKVEEQEDKTILVTLEVAELPEDIKTLLQERMSHAESDHSRGHCCFMSEFCSIEKGRFSFAMTVSKNYDIEKIVIAFDGARRNEENEQHLLDIVAELQLNK
ncbi:hypothetical protein [Pelosinus baikalensis]|uniref:Uncharacterized protein n=1 Tax=Pelosinus baikalensis TaxID=2892015 RepID=A0ABS8HWJ9_9FIRM|nr:hypothetical protein [Pelosinus baikalensis]MCC5466359.1 hypothetical protein [Pelosinus baikalensis]